MEKSLHLLDVEHPTGFFSVEIETETKNVKDRSLPAIKRVALLRTARLLMRGEVLIPDLNSQN